MAEIKLYDYSKTVDDGWGAYEERYYIGMGDLSSNVIVPLIEAVPEDEEITVKINSSGGFVFDGWSIYNALKSHKAKVIIRIDGLAASIASIIAMAGDEIVMAKASMLMIHKPTVDLWCCGSVDAEFLKKEAGALDSIQAVLNSIYLDKSSLDELAINSLINSESWITPQNALAMGFATSIDDQVKEKITVAENAFNHLFKNANSDTRKYANSIINIHKNKNMADSKETIEAVKESTKSTNALLSFFKNLMPKNEGEQPVNASVIKEDGTSLYYEGDLAVDTAVFTDEAMTMAAEDGEHLLDDGRTIVVASGVVTEIKEAVAEADDVAVLNARITELEAENASMQASLNEANTSLNAANEVLTKFKNTKSNWTPKPKEQNFAKPKNNEPEKLDLSREAREARKQEVANKNNKK